MDENQSMVTCLKFNIDGHRANDWPKIKILLNNTLLFNNTIVGSCQLEFQAELKDQNQLIIELYDKNNDTQVDTAGHVIADCHAIINAVHIDNIKFDINDFSNYKFFYCTCDGEQLVTNYLGKEGQLTIDFSWPAWKLWYDLKSRP